MLTEKTQLEYINYGNIQKYINQDLLMAIMGLPTVINSIQWSTSVHTWAHKKYAKLIFNCDVNVINIRPLCTVIKF